MHLAGCTHKYVAKPPSLIYDPLQNYRVVILPVQVVPPSGLWSLYCYVASINGPDNALYATLCVESSRGGCLLTNGGPADKRGHHVGADDCDMFNLSDISQKRF